MGALTTKQSRILAMCHAIRSFQQELEIGDFDSIPKIYFEFTDMAKMKRAEVALIRAFEPLYPMHGDGGEEA